MYIRKVCEKNDKEIEKTGNASMGKKCRKTSMIKVYKTINSREETQIRNYSPYLI